MGQSQRKSPQRSSAAESRILPLLDRLEQGETLLFETLDEVYSFSYAELIFAQGVDGCPCDACARIRRMPPRMEAALRVLWGKRGEEPIHDLPYAVHAFGGVNRRSFAAIQIAAVMAGRKLTELRCGTTISSAEMAVQADPIEPRLAFTELLLRENRLERPNA